jgi:hypothetical protein
LKTATTRTLNPLPFNDLEPHRFEDLIRQLAYEFRRWRSLEASGRAGSEEGLDIRAIEFASHSQPCSWGQIGVYSLPALAASGTVFF